MDKPICRLCGKKHWGGCEFREEDIVIPEESAAVKLAMQARKKPKFDRVTYQREYMRKRRAKK